MVLMTEGGEKHWAQFRWTSCKTQKKNPLRDFRLFQFYLSSHPERYRLLLWLCFGTRWWWSWGAIAPCPAWRSRGGESCPRVTWPWGSGGGAPVLLLIRGVACVPHQTRFQSFHNRLWKNRTKKEKRETRHKWRREKKQQKTSFIWQKFIVTTKKKTFWEKQIVNRFRLNSCQ